jgi:hypothetical protein
MTDKEHALMMMMFTRQTQHIKMLVDLLENKGIIQGDDAPAFDSVVRNDPASVSLFLQVISQYKSFANQLGMEVREPGEIPLDKT